MPGQYQDLIESPNENLSVEYKSWLDLTEDNEARADLARHIAAIANHGGGMIVFGFDDNLQPSKPNAIAAAKVTRDTVSSIVKKYLEPTFHCDVEVVTAAAGTSHPVIIVPPHGASPICAKAGGPQVDGRPKGIVLGTYYIRKPGPESERILTAAEWAPLIRRCALHERASILSAIELTMRGGPVAEDQSNKDLLRTWHEAALAQFQKDCDQVGMPARLKTNNVQFSYSIHRADGQRLNPALLRDPLLLQMNTEVKDRVRTGWSMFYPFNRAPIAPQFTMDAASGDGEEDFIETSLIRERPQVRLSTSCDFWRISPAGKATLIRPYPEDDDDAVSRYNLPVGGAFDPKLHVMDVAEFVRHAQAFAGTFDAPMFITFLMEWRGLAGRTIHSPRAYYSIPGQATAAGRRTSAEVSVASLDSNWPEIVSELVAPVLRLFNTSFQVTPDWVRGQAPTWLH